LLAAEGRRSIFNILGPLLNPARPDHQLIGVFDASLAQAFGQILLRIGRKAAWVVHGRTEDGRGMDELSTLGENTVVSLKDGALSTQSLRWTSPTKATIDDLAGGDATDNADILEGVLAGRIRGAKRDIAVLNAAAGFVITSKAADITVGTELAEDILERGAAHAKLRAMQDFC
jgi:anthranilate phosphoribosyltransferase